MQGIGKYIEKIRTDEKVQQRIFLITLIMALFALILAVQDSQINDKYVIDQTGRVVGILRDSLASPEDYDLNLSIISDSETSNREVQIHKQAVSAKTGKSAATEENTEMKREAEITGIITDIELSEEKQISLPANLSDGSRLIWSINTSAVDKGFLFIPLVYLVLVSLVIKSSVDSVRDVDKEARETIIMGLPRFTNQLLLMLNAGMILSDAVENIGYSYTIFGEEHMGFFEKELVKLADKNSDHRRSTAEIINEFAGRYNVKELMRISTILTENERRGSDVIDNLERESKYLWNDRKIIARERGKMIDTKMSYPLAILLVLLIVITMAPALLNL